MEIGLLGNLQELQEHRIHSASAPGPQLQLGRPPRAGRKKAAVLIRPNHFLLNLLHQFQFVRILGNHRELKMKKILSLS